MQRCGVEEVSRAFDTDESIVMLLINNESDDSEVEKLRQRAINSNIVVKQGSPRHLWRMAKRTSGEIGPNILALIGRDPTRSSAEIFADGGLVWLLSGAQYAQNIGYSIRTVEVSGADAIIIDTDLTSDQRRIAKRTSMRANRFLTLEWADSLSTVIAAKEAGARIIAIEDIGQTEPWDADFTGPVLLIVGGERHGISVEILDEADDIIRIPMAGFVPSYNLQAPLAVVAVEALRQRRE
jgi:23S rRNA (guanosine2251-2'-O)-methyltransferase